MRHHALHAQKAGAGAGQGDGGLQDNAKAEACPDPLLGPPAPGPHHHSVTDGAWQSGPIRDRERERVPGAANR